MNENKTCGCESPDGVVCRSHHKKAMEVLADNMQKRLDALVRERDKALTVVEELNRASELHERKQLRAENERLTRELGKTHALATRALCERGEVAKERDTFQRGVETTLFALTGESDLGAAMTHLKPDVTLDEYARRVVDERNALRALLRRKEGA